MVQEVERVGAEVQSAGFAEPLEGNRAIEREVDVEQARAAERVAPEIAVAGDGFGEGRAVEQRFSAA